MAAGRLAVERAIRHWLDEHVRGRRILVATSGGLDSMVLLDALAMLAAPGQLHVGHVDHALQAQSAAWARFVARQAQRRGVGVTIERLAGAPARGESTEAWAREARYAALDRMAETAGCELLACAHHADDQIETLLLALARGAGLRGLAAMPAPGEGTLRIHRPLLAVPRSAVAAWAAARALEFVEDPTNAQLHFVRNALRHEVLPALEAVLPGFRTGALRALGHLAQARATLAEIGTEELDRVADEHGRISAARLAQRSPARRALVLRALLARHRLRAPSAARLADWCRQLEAPGAPPVRLPHEGAWLCRYRDAIWIEQGGAGRIAMAGTAPQSCAGPNDLALPVRWSAPDTGELVLPAWGGRLCIAPGGPVAADWLRRQDLLVRRARGRDRLRVQRDGPSRSVRNLWQEQGIPPWLRPGLPCVEIEGRLAFVAGPGLAADLPAPAPGAPGLGLRFEPSRRDDPRWPYLAPS